MLMKRLILLFAISLFTLSISAQSESEIIDKVLELGKSNNTTMQQLDILSNRIGGRIVGSNALQNAEKWAATQFESWGYEVRVEEVGAVPVGFNRGPWFGRMLSEDGMILHFSTPSYTSGTKGVQRGQVLMEPKSRGEFERMKGALKGAWVLITGTSDGFPIDWSPKADSARTSIIAKNEDIVKKNNEIRAYNNLNPDAKKELLPLLDEPALFYREMINAGVLGFIQSSPLPLRLLYDRKNCFNITWDNLPSVPDIKLNEHQYKIIEQKVKERQFFELEFDIRNHFFPGPVKFHNVIAVMKGSEYPDEYVMVGGHLDSYDIGTGAVDDGNGTVVTMEAARLLALAGAKPKRTILFCLWSAEEFGLLGSKHWVENHKELLPKISNYFNRDGGPTVVSSITVTPAMYDDFVKISEPIATYNPEFPFKVYKAEKPKIMPKQPGGSDHAYFEVNGVPTYSLSNADVKGYNFNYGEIWHTERDTYNKAYPDYLNHSSVVNAVIVFGLANLDHLLSREGMFQKEEPATPSKKAKTK